MHIFGHLFVCFQTSVYIFGEFHKNTNNSTVFEELEVSMVDLTVANAVLLATRRCRKVMAEYVYIGAGMNVSLPPVFRKWIASVEVVS